jgi:hypothetical protein
LTSDGQREDLADNQPRDGTKAELKGSRKEQQSIKLGDVHCAATHPSGTPKEDERDVVEIDVEG